MFSESAELYDTIYGSFKDYHAEAARVAELLRQVHPATRTVLDVACGTGEHARLLIEQHGFAVDGIDLDPNLLEIARSKNPGARFTCADMTAFDLGQEFDAVVCLFSSIGYARTLDRLTDALRCFRRHVNPGGVVVVEPWFQPSGFTPGYVTMRTVEEDGWKICRMTRNEVEAGLSRLHFEYLIGEAEQIRHFSEVHELGLFTGTEMMAAFGEAGLDAEYDPYGLSGRGLYTARAAR